MADGVAERAIEGRVRYAIQSAVRVKQIVPKSYSHGGDVLVGSTKGGDIADRDHVGGAARSARAVSNTARKDSGVRDEPSARRFQFALGSDGIGLPGQDPKFEFRLLTEQGNDFHVYVMT